MSGGDVEDLVLEWLALREEGRAPDPDTFAASHPSHHPALQDALRDLLETERTLPSPGGVPERFGRWRILGLLGSGGSGLVFRAEDTGAPGTQVALKLLSPARAGDPRARVRLAREARVLGPLDHPGIVRILDADLEAPLPWLVMELVPGKSLRQIMDAARATAAGDAGGSLAALLGLPGEGGRFDGVARVGRDLARAVAWAHERGLVHRDLKPANVMIRPDGAPVILDFGLAADPEASALTRTGDILGTPAYMAPEQIRGRRVGPAADVYSLGALLYEAATLRPPFPGDDTTEVMARAVASFPPRIRALVPGFPAALADLIEAAMAPRAAWRPPAATLAGGFQAFLEDGPAGIRPPGVLRRLAWRIAARPRLVAVAAVIILALAIVGLIMIRAEERAGRKRAVTRALTEAALHLVEPIAGPGLEGTARALSTLDPESPTGPLLEALARGRAPTPPPEDPSAARLARAEAARLRGERDMARGLLEAAARDEPDSDLAWALLARLALDDPERARICGQFAEAAAARQGRAVVEAGLGHLLLLEGRPSEAAAAFARARAAAPAPDLLPYHEAAALRRAGRADDALATARAAGPDILLRHARLLDREGARPEASAVFREVIAAAPERIDARFHLANSLAAAEEVEAAAVELRAILVLAPDHAPALVTLAWIHAWVCGHDRCAVVKDPDRALALAAAAVRADAGAERSILTTATRIARHLDRRDELRPAIDEALHRRRESGAATGLLEDALRELDLR